MGWDILGIQLITLATVCYDNLIHGMLQLYYKLSPHVLKCMAFSSGAVLLLSPCRLLLEPGASLSVLPNRGRGHRQTLFFG